MEGSVGSLFKSVDEEDDDMFSGREPVTTDGSEVEGHIADTYIYEEGDYTNPDPDNNVHAAEEQIELEDDLDGTNIDDTDLTSP